VSAGSPGSVPCRACGRPVAEGAERCPHCRVALAERLRCPHCDAIGDPERSPWLRFTCATCGAPVVPVADASVPRTFAEAPALLCARRAFLARSAWLAAAAVAAGFGALSVLALALAVAFASPPAIAVAFAAVAAIVPFLFAAIGVARARLQARAWREALDAAWTSVAAELARARGGIDAPALGRLTGVSEAIAEQVVARVAVDAMLARPARTRVAEPAADEDLARDAGSRRHTGETGETGERRE
jgi:hypothetical protein